MPPIDIGRSLTSVGVGLADEVLEWWDEKELRTESFRTARDIGRLAIAGLGYGLQVFMPRQAKLGETLALSATPLLTKSIAKPIRAAIAPAPAPVVGPGGAYVPRRRATNAPVPTPAGSPGGPVAARSYIPQAEKVRILG